MRVELSHPIDLVELSSFLNWDLSNLHNSSHIIKAICTDSREAEKGDLFFALKSDKDDGNNYIEAAIKKGCTAVGNKDLNGCIYSSDAGYSLIKTAEFYKSHLKQIKCTVAITGSVGKSTTKEYIKHILSDMYRVHATYGNFNNQIGVPLTVLGTPKNAEILILEMGMNHIGEISALSKCAKPDIALITSIGSSHIGNLGSIENIIKAKSEIKDGMTNGTVIIPAENPLLYSLTGGYTFGYNTIADFMLTPSHTYNGTYDFTSPERCISNIRCGISAEHLLSNLCGAASVSCMISDNMGKIKKSIRTITSAQTRQRFIRFSDFSIFDDSYNSSFESVLADLKFMVKEYPDLPIGVFVGDILELGEKSEQIHLELGSLIAQFKPVSIYAMGNYASFIKDGAITKGFNEKRIFINEDAKDKSKSIEQLLKNHSINEVILFKASHNLRFDIIADMIAKKERANNG